MIDSLLSNLKRAQRHQTRLGDLGLQNKDYAVLTLHRPSNVDQHTSLTGIVEALECAILADKGAWHTAHAQDD